jgi:oligogalacturonide lyase
VAKGDVYDAEWRTFNHPETGVKVTQLTNHRGHTTHLYFTNPGWYAGGSKLLVSSDRNNVPHLYGVDLRDGRITQLTDLPSFSPSAEVQFMHSGTNPVREEAYYWYGTRLTPSTS